MKYALIGLLVLSSCGRGPMGPQGLAGPQGDAGEDGSDAILEVIDPCGDAANIVDEILIRLADGRVMCSFSANANGHNTRLAILPSGTYMTTDGSNCVFTINAQGQVQ